MDTSQMQDHEITSVTSMRAHLGMVSIAKHPCCSSRPRLVSILECEFRVLRHFYSTYDTHQVATGYNSLAAPLRVEQNIGGEAHRKQRVSDPN